MDTTGAMQDNARSGVDRRSAMKAALGGAAAAAVLSAPKVKSFSLAPNYAAAATQAGPGCTTLTAGPQGRESVACSAGTCCWVSQSGATCGSATLFTLGSGPQISVALEGKTTNSTGKLTYTMSSFDGIAYTDCDVVASVVCSSGTPHAGTQNFTGNGPKTQDVYCSAGTSPTASVSVTMTCYCPAGVTGPL